jgi:hypothetical protein
MLKHLNANGVATPDGEAVLTQGEWLSVDPKSETFVDNDRASELRARKYRQPFAVPDLERDLGEQSAAAAG